MKPQEKNNKTKINLFEDIALTFSGGGYRAATFSLGILSYFDHTPLRKDDYLLQHVKGLSTVSGGSITGAVYAHSAATDMSFIDFFKKMYELFDSDYLNDNPDRKSYSNILLATAIQKLEDDTLWNNGHKRRTLINAFALAYEKLLDTGTFHNLLLDDKSHLEDVCINATDFSFGLAFRFQITGDFGNFRLKNNNLDTLVPEMFISDAIASSSCFPMGFEPMIMPDDFVSMKNSDAYIAIKQQNIYAEGVGIMDGGIVDNQGIGSIMLAENRRKSGFDQKLNLPTKSSIKKSPYDLIMVCDVGSYFMEPWKHSTINENKKWGNLTIQKAINNIRKTFNNYYWFIIALAAGIVFSCLGYLDVLGKWSLLLGGALTGLGVIGVFIYILFNLIEKKIVTKWNWILGMIPSFIKNQLGQFKDLKLRLVQRMLEDRATSAFKMINEIFLKQIRRLNYDLFYKDSSLKNRRITALIYQLTKEQYSENESDEIIEQIDKSGISIPGDRIYAAAKIARETGTTLWFTDEDKKVHRIKNLIATGQFTACYNLLKYCNDLKYSNSVEVDVELLNTMIDRLNNDWLQFIKDPYWMFTEYFDKIK